MYLSAGLTLEPGRRDRHRDPGRRRRLAPAAALPAGRGHGRHLRRRRRHADQRAWSTSQPDGPLRASGRSRSVERCIASARCRRVSDSARRPLPSSIAARICSCSSASRPMRSGRLALALVDHLADPRHPQPLHELDQEVDCPTPARARCGTRGWPRSCAGRWGSRDAGRPARRASGPAAPAAARRRPAGPRRARSPAAPRRPRCMSLGADVGHARAAVGAHLHQPLGGQAAQRLAHRRARDAQILGQILLMDARPALQRALDDPVADRRVDLVDDAGDGQRSCVRPGWRLCRCIPSSDRGGQPRRAPRRVASTSSSTSSSETISGGEKAIALAYGERPA